MRPRMLLLLAGLSTAGIAAGHPLGAAGADWLDTLRPPLRGIGSAPAPAPAEPSVATASVLSPQEWLDTIRIPLRSEGGPPAESAKPSPSPGGQQQQQQQQRVECPGVGSVEFEPGTAQTTDDGRRTLDGLAAALTSPELADSKFQILWLDQGGGAGALAARRAGAIKSALRAEPSLPATRLTMKPATAFDDCPLTPSADAVALLVRVVGRWWGGQ